MSDDFLLPLKDPQDWRALAACKHADTAIFFDHKRQDEAFAYCAICPDDVKTQCGIAGEKEYGIWGGRPERNSLTCRNCGQAFPKNNRGGKQPLMCSDRCRNEAAAASRKNRSRRYVESLLDHNTTCEDCGEECYTRSRWGAHRWYVHGIAGVSRRAGRHYRKGAA